MALTIKISQYNSRWPGQFSAEKERVAQSFGPELACVAGSMLTSLLVKGGRATSVMATGFLLAAAGFLVLIRAGEPATLPTTIIGYTVFSLGLAPVPPTQWLVPFHPRRPG